MRFPALYAGCILICGIAVTLRIKISIGHLPDFSVFDYVVTYGNQMHDIHCFVHTFIQCESAGVFLQFPPFAPMAERILIWFFIFFQNLFRKNCRNVFHCCSPHFPLNNSRFHLYAIRYILFRIYPHMDTPHRACREIFLHVV